MATGNQRAASSPADGGFKPITFTRSDERGDHELIAHSAADAVKLRFDGWTEKTTRASRTAGATSTQGTTGPAAG